MGDDKEEIVYTLKLYGSSRIYADYIKGVLRAAIISLLYIDIL